MTTPITWKNEQADLSGRPALRALDSVARGCLALFLALSMFSISAAQSALTAGLLAWLAHTHFTGGWRALRWPVVVPFALFWLAAIVSVALAEDPARAVWGLKKLPQVLLFFWALNLIRNQGERDRWVLLLIGSASAAALFGVYQAVSAGVSLSQRVNGTLSIYMTFSGLLMLVGLTVLGRLLFRRPREHWLAGVFCLLVFCLLLTLTRQAWLGVLVGGIFLIFLWRKTLLIAVPVVIFVLVLFSPQAVRDRMVSLTNYNDVTLQERLALWRVGWMIFEDHPILGCGFYCVVQVRGEYPDPMNIVARVNGMHSNVLQILVDTGLLGFAAWSALWVCYLITVYRHAPPGGPKGMDWAAGAAMAAVLGFLAAGMFEANFYDSEVAMVLYFIMALPFVRAEKAPAAAQKGAS